MHKSKTEELEQRVQELERELEQSVQREKRLKVDADRFELAMAFGSGGHFDWNLETDEIYFSPGWKRILGYQDEEIENKFSEWERLTKDQDVAASWQMLKELLEGRIERFEMEFQMRHKDGHWVDILSRANALYNGEGRPFRVIGSHSDITARKRSQVALRDREELFRALFEQGSGYCMLLEPHESGIPRIVDVNEAASKAHGFTREEMIGRPVADLDDDAGKRLVIERTNLILSGETLLVETDHVRKDGTVFPVAVCANVVHFADRPPLILTLEHDLTEVRKAEADRLELEKHRRHAQQMDAVGVLAGGLAHDFNNILTVIMGNASLAQSEVPDGELSQLLSRILDGAKQAQGLTQQLLTFAKGGAPIKKPADLNQLIMDSAEFVTSGKNSICDFELSEALRSVEVDAGQMSQTVSNLVMNATEAMPDGGTIRIQTSNFKLSASSALPLGPGDYVRLDVSDEGVGIAKEQILKIFDPYFSNKEGGTGLGLAITYSIVSRHGGHIAVDSTVGEGTTFSIFLPASEKSVQKLKRREGETHRGQGRVLVLDDQEGVLLLAQKLLQGMGYEVCTVTDGADAITLYEQALNSATPFDLVILDLTIPGGMGGASVIPELLRLNPEVRAIVSSGYSNDPVMASYADHGFCGVIPKPYTREQLSDLLEQIQST